MSNQEDNDNNDNNKDQIEEEDLKWVFNEVGATLEEIELAANPDWAGELNRDDMMYEIDFDKVKTIEDINLILSALQIRFGGIHHDFHKLKHLLKGSNNGD